MFKFKQNGKSRIVMTGGNVIAEFEDGIAVVDKAAAYVLSALGYEVEAEDSTGSDDGSQTETEEQTNDADGEAPAENTGNKRSGRGKSA